MESEVKYGHVEIEVITYPSKDFNRNMEYMSLEFSREVMLEIHIYCEILIISMHVKAK